MCEHGFVGSIQRVLCHVELRSCKEFGGLLAMGQRQKTGGLQGARKVLAAARTGPERTEFRAFDMPDILDDAALLKVEIAGICGTDVKLYSKPPISEPVIMGHENIGIIAKAGKTFQERRGLKEGDRVFAEHYVGCMSCEHCHRGDYRLCMATDRRENSDGIRFGYTP